MMTSISRTAMLLVALAGAGCASSAKPPPTARAPGDPLAQVDAAALRARGLAFARRGDHIRAEQYLQASLAKGYDESVIVPELLLVCSAASRYRAALSYAESYLDRNPDDSHLRYIVGTLYLVLGNTDLARDELLQVEETGEMPEALVALAQLDVDAGDFVLARERLESYVAENHDGSRAHEAKALLRKVRRQTPKKGRRR